MNHVDVIELPLPAGHPSRHGRIALAVRWSGEGRDRRIDAVEAVVGAVHRGAEKLAEVRDYRQVIVLLDRHDWWGAFGSELAFVLAVERMVGIPVPARATLLRTVHAELTRCISHLAFLAGAVETAHPQPARTGTAALWAAMAEVRDRIEEASGNRVHPMLCRVGGLAHDVDDDWPRRVSGSLPVITVAADTAREALAEVGSGLAPLDVETIAAYAVSGPVARACGVNVDLRRDEPCLAYADVFTDADVVVATTGDAAARFRVMAVEVGVSCAIVERCLERLAPGPVAARTPRTLRVPEGSAFAWTESPQGASGYYLVSEGGPAPARLKIRTSTFDTAAVLGVALRGVAERNLPSALASLPLLAGDIDR